VELSCNRSAAAAAAEWSGTRWWRRGGVSYRVLSGSCPGRVAGAVSGVDDDSVDRSTEPTNQRHQGVVVRYDRLP